MHKYTHTQGKHARDGGYESIDASMDAHFSSIQDSFVPKEVKQLMGVLQGKLAEVGL
jgi:hypothetical protein